MPFRRRPHVTASLLLTLLFLSAAAAQGAEIFLSPDTLYLSGAIGSQVELELRVDDATSYLSVYEIVFWYDDAKFDVDTVVQGPLFPSGGQTQFDYFVDNDSILTINDFIFGYRTWVNGPGLLATVTLTLQDSGLTQIVPIDFRLRDSLNNPIDGTAAGNTTYSDYPPLPFNTVNPAYASTLTGTGCPGDMLTFEWEATESVYPGESVLYRLEYASASSFAPAVTQTVSGLSGTQYTVPSDTLIPRKYYWRVFAVGDLYGHERQSLPNPAQFTFQLNDVDGDTVGNDCDNCPEVFNPDQEDGDGDTVGDACDNCPADANAGQEDGDSDNVGNVCDNCPEVYNPNQSDIDTDGVGDLCDNCPDVYNPGQEDEDHNEIGDACQCDCPYQADFDEDGFATALDLAAEIDVLFAGKDDSIDPNCPTTRSDVDCDGFATAIDLGKLIDFLFAGGAPPCDPCSM